MTLTRFLASITLLALALWFAAPAEVWQAMRGINPGWLALAAFLLAVQIALSALRWQITAEALGTPLPRRWSLQEYGLSVAVNTFLPGGVMGDLTRIARTRHLGWRLAASSVVIERLAGQIALATVTVVALAIWLGGGHGTMLIATSLVVLALLFRLFPAPVATLAKVWLAPRLWRVQAALTLTILTVNLAGFWTAAQSVGLTLPLASAALLIPLTLLSMLIPVTINGWGLREGVAAALWPLWGIATAEAVAASLAFGLACMAAALLGLLPWLLRTTPQPDTQPRP